MKARARVPSRTLAAAMLLVAALAALLVAWFLSGWADVRAQQKELAAAPARAAEAKGSELAHDLRAELARLVAREVERPYFHYQNLMHDPRSGETLNVSPSPLAGGPQDALVLGYFQVDSAGRVSTPPINDDIPSLSEPKNFAGNARFRDEVAKNFIASVQPAPVAEARGVQVASVAPAAVASAGASAPRRPPVVRPPVVATNAAATNAAATNAAPPERPVTVAVATPQAQAPQPQAPQPQAPQPQVQAPQAQAPQAQAPQVLKIDESSYVQNSMPSEVYWQQQSGPRATRNSVQQRSSSSPQQRVMPQQQANAPPQQQVQASNRVEPRMAPPDEGPAQQASPPPQPQPAAPSEPPLEPQQPVEAPQPAPAPAIVEAPKPAPRPAPRPARVPPTPAPPPAPITITISPLEWRTLPYDGQPSLVAVRHVETPDVNLSQGFVLDRAAVSSWLASRADDAVVEVKSGPAANKEEHAAEIAPGWYLDVAASPRAIADAAGDAAQVAAAFLARFVIVGVIALLAAALVVLLVSRAERLASERSQFAAAAAHELRTPLAGLQLYGDMLADGLGDPSKMRDYARRMSEEASRLGRVVSNVLGFSQLERGNLSVEARAGDLGAALCELAERAQPALDRAGAVLELDVPPELAAKYDRDALARIVGNLLDNAEKYGRESEDRTIGLRARDAGAHVEVEVTDRGPGIAPAARGKLFRAFSRGVSSDGPAGLGLGLALSQSLARAMGGELELRAPSGAAQGATFVLRLAKP